MIVQKELALRSKAALALGLCLSSGAMANVAITAPVKDWTGDGRINRLDQVYYNVFVFNPSAGYLEWPRGLDGSLIYKFSCKETCHG